MIFLITAFSLLNLSNESLAGTSNEVTIVACDDTAVTTGKKRNIVRRDTFKETRQYLRTGPSNNFDKIINQKGSSPSRTRYQSVDASTVVYEECTKSNWSWIRIIEPSWLSSRSGWIESKSLTKEKSRIGMFALSPYTIKHNPEVVKEYKSRLHEIEKYRVKASKIILDNKSCDYIETVELSVKSTLNNLHFWVECRNLQRFNFSEHNL